MQSGMAKAKHWCLKFEPIQCKNVEPLMGYTSSTDTRQQLDLTFETKEDAIAYAKRHGIDYQVSEHKKRKRIVKAYSDNFAINRIDGNWTH